MIVIQNKEADTVGSLQSKSVSIESILENSWHRSIKEFLKWNKGDISRTNMNSRRSKRVKNEIHVDHEIIENIYFDPIVSLFFYFRQNMLSEIWTLRQYSWANILCLIKHVKLQDYLSLVPDLLDVDSLAEWLMIDLATRAIIVTLIDHFSDFQENRLLAPVRELSVKLMIPYIHIIPVKQLLGTVLSSNKVYWMFKYNVLLILKTIMKEGKHMLEESKNSRKENAKIKIIEEILAELKNNKKILDNVWKCLSSEDEVKILAFEWIEEMIDNFLWIESDDSDDEEEKHSSSKKDKNNKGNINGNKNNHKNDEIQDISSNIKNNSLHYINLVEQVLNKSDDVEWTAISVFNLLIKITKHPKFNQQTFVNLESTLPFNFHRVIQVRLSFTILIKQISILEKENYKRNRTLHFMNSEVLKKIFVLGVQAWIIENNSKILKNWHEILKNIWGLISIDEETPQIINQFIDSYYYDWVMQKVFISFEHFLFLSNENFEPINSYYELVNKPITQSDIDTDFFVREWNSSKCLAIIRAYADNKELQESTMSQLLHRGWLIDTPFWNLQTQHFLFYYHLSCIECKDNNFEKEQFLSKETIKELFTILEQIDLEKYCLPYNLKLKDFINHFEVLGHIISKSNENDVDLIDLYENIVKTINGIINFEK